MGKDKEQIAFRVTPQMKREIDLIMDSDGSRTRNEFLEHAVKSWKSNSEPTTICP